MRLLNILELFQSVYIHKITNDNMIQNVTRNQYFTIQTFNSKESTCKIICMIWATFFFLSSTF